MQMMGLDQPFLFLIKKDVINARNRYSTLIKTKSISPLKNDFLLIPRNMIRHTDLCPFTFSAPPEYCSSILDISHLLPEIL